MLAEHLQFLVIMSLNYSNFKNLDDFTFVYRILSCELIIVVIVAWKASHFKRSIDAFCLLNLYLSIFITLYLRQKLISCCRGQALKILFAPKA